MIKKKKLNKEGVCRKNFIFINHKKLAKNVCSKYNLNKKSYFLFLKLLKKIGVCEYNPRGCYLEPSVKKMILE
ncbi:MAG: hypothetical protein DRP10_02900 [Candidatus Aenigmatarchaeota archaeon]|nr:MAG: hypothetical protein DRP10_02900 [Candidatus Aenigmarchaeota archaeon]